MTFKINKGFTLIEVLVVIAIIGVLSSVVLASVNGARIRAEGMSIGRNMHEIANALEVYRLSHGKVIREKVWNADGSCDTTGSDGTDCGIWVMQGVFFDGNGNPFDTFTPILQPLINEKLLSKIETYQSLYLFQGYKTTEPAEYTKTFYLSEGFPAPYYYSCGDKPHGDYVIFVNDDTEKYGKYLGMDQFGLWEFVGEVWVFTIIPNFYCITN